MSAPRSQPTDLEGQLREVRLLVLDVDGTLTDGRVVYVGEEEQQNFSVHDGQGLAWLIRAGIRVAWISGRGSRATRRRAEELGVHVLHLETRDKAGALAGVQSELEIPEEATASMGDDLPDLALARHSSLFAAPANARAEVRAVAQLVTEAEAGHGAVRELCERLLRAQGRWDEILEGHAS